MFGGNKKKECWSSRKFSLCYQVEKNRHQTEFTVGDLWLPWDCPRNVQTASYEAFRTAYCFLHMEREGIAVNEIELNLNYFKHIKLAERGNDSPFILLHQFLKRKAGEASTVIFNREELLEHIPKKITQTITETGDGYFPMQKEEDQDIAKAFYAAFGFMKFSVDVDHKKLAKAIDRQVKDYKKQKLTLARGNYFGETFCQDVMGTFLKVLAYWQGTNIRFVIDEQEDELNEFIEVFQESYPKAFRYWKKGSYLFPFLLNLKICEMDKKIIVNRIETMPSDEQNSLKYFSGHHLPLVTSIDMEIIPPTKSSHFTLPWRGEKIGHIIVVVSEGKDYKLYLNNNLLRPIDFSKRQKSGRLIYQLAEEKYAPYDDYAKTFEYIQGSKEYRLFSKTNLKHTRILDRDEDGDIIFDPDIQVEFIEEDELLKRITP